MRWQKSTYSSSNGTCVELATDGTSAYVRNSNRPEAGTLTLTADAWRELLDAAKAGALDGLLEHVI